jgi:hypothetical protein
MKAATYPTREEASRLGKLGAVSKRGLVGLSLIAFVSIAPRCGGVIEGHPARNAQVSKAEVRTASFQARTTQAADAPDGAAAGKSVD